MFSWRITSSNTHEIGVDGEDFSLEADLKRPLWFLREERDGGCSAVHSGTSASSWNTETRACSLWREQRCSTGLPRQLTWIGTPPPEGRRHLLDAAPLWPTPPATASPLPPSTGCSSSSHTARSVQSGLGVAWKQNRGEALRQAGLQDSQQHTTKGTKITQSGFLAQSRCVWWLWRLAARSTGPAEASRLYQTRLQDG